MKPLLTITLLALLAAPAGLPGMAPGEARADEEKDDCLLCNPEPGPLGAGLELNEPAREKQDRFELSRCLENERARGNDDTYRALQHCER